MRKMMRAGTGLSTFFLYVGIIIVATLCIAFSLDSVVRASASLVQVAQRDKTPLEIKIDSARQIRESLSKPQPTIEPLPPITAKLARAVTAAKAVSNQKPKTLSSEALNSFAAAPEWSPAAHSVVDRHASSF